MDDYEIIARTWNVPIKPGEYLRVTTVNHERRNENPMCPGCHAPCCRGSVSAILNDDEFLKRKFEFEFMKSTPTFKRTVPRSQAIVVVKKKNGVCWYFDSYRLKCTVWPDIPKACLAFDCRLDYRPSMKSFAKKRTKQWQRARLAEKK